jgi:hypothetical protein
MFEGEARPMRAATSTDQAIKIGVIVLTIGTALIHFSLLFPDPMFIMNGLGYLALLAALYLPIPQLAGRQRLVRWVLIGYTLLAVVIWAAIGSRIPIAYLDKIIEVLLIVLLVIEDRRSKAP